MIRAAIIDDEPLARRRVRRALSRMPDVEIVGEAGNIRDAVALIEQQAPNLLLLDIQMPNGSGFELLAGLQAAPPAVVFVTVYDEYAIAAFEARAVDYVLKPVEFERLELAVERARGVIERREQEQRLVELQMIVGSLRGALHEHAERNISLWVSSRGETHRIRANEIVWIQAERDYVRLHTGDRSYLYHESLAALERKLDPDSFIRVHRSAILRRQHVRSFRRGQFASLTAVLDDGTEIRVGRTYERIIRDAIRQAGKI